jgi:hypothetical protein
MSRYSVMERDGVKLYLSQALWRWAKSVHVDVHQGWFAKGFEIGAEHRHNASCSH